MTFAARVRRDFESGIRAGVIATPAVFARRARPRRLRAVD